MLEKLVIPKNTKFDERSIVIEGDALIGANSRLGYGIIARKVIVGDRTEIRGDILGREEVRLGAWCTVRGDVISKGDAYVGEFTSIEGRLTVYGDLEIGRNVKIKNGFEARGLITIQDPMPIVMFIFLYILAMLRLGKYEEIEELFETEEFLSPLQIPENSEISLDYIKTRRDVLIEGSRVLGNLRCRDAKILESELYGSVRGRNVIVEGSRVHGVIEGGDVYLVRGSVVLGKITADNVYMEEGCVVEGSIVGRKGVWIKPHVELPEEILNDDTTIDQE
jgi:predicted acyltransferase (DUF342 family)